MPITLLKTILSFLSKYWLHILILGIALYLINWYGDKKFTEGYTFAKAKYEEEYRQKLELEKKDYLAKKEAFEAAILDAKQKESDANKAKEDAERKAQENKRKSDYYYTQWQEVLKNGQIPYTGPDGPYHFTYGFVGLYNLAVRVPDVCQPESGSGVSTSSLDGCRDKREINVSEVATASGLERSASADALAQQSPVTEEEVLSTTQYNYQIANACIVERKLINEYFNKLCELGYCQ